MVWDRTIETIARAFHEAGGAKWENVGDDLRQETLAVVEDEIAANPDLFAEIAKACFDNASGQDDDATHQARIEQILQPIIPHSPS
ncbi:hypothetical protein [Mesorhizobium sp. NPDC059025]|uniref:hypothetical protein n=1 Tax=unclassified Mesorhizobium TaxID=325217 RepID=UPI00368C2798